MYADMSHLVKLFQGVERIRESIQQYSLPGRAVSVGVEHFLNAFEQMYGCSIRIGYVPGSKDEFSRGIYLRYPDRVDILLDNAMEPYRKRFVAVKEMCQLILSEDEYLTRDAPKLVSTMLAEIKSSTDGLAPSDVVADSWAEIAALELLFPTEERIMARDQFAAGSTTLFQLSELYQLPEDVIEEAFAPDHHRACEKAWEAIRNPDA